MIPKTVTGISGNPFVESSAVCIYGYAGSAAQTLETDYGCCFVGISDAWIAGHGK